jgi:hypothetical protein
MNVISLDKARIRILKRRHDESHCDKCQRLLDIHKRMYLLPNGRVRCVRCHLSQPAPCQPSAS